MTESANAVKRLSAGQRTPHRRLTEFALAVLAFGLVYGFYLRFFDDGLPLERTLLGCAASAIAYWLASQLKDGSGDDGNEGATFLEQLSFGAGVSLLVHAVVTYGLLSRRTPFLVVGGSLTAAIFVWLFRRWRPFGPRFESRILLVGFDVLAGRLLAGLEQPVVGVWGPCQVPPPLGLAVLGNSPGGEEVSFAGVAPPLSFSEVVAIAKPSMIVIALADWETLIPPHVLLGCRLAGIRITNSAALYEKLFSRVCCERLQPVDLVLSTTLRGDSRTMAIQAVYNNFLGLLILLFLLPFLLVVAVAIWLTAGPGPAIESVECAGFQYIPFRLQRFRTTRADGSRTAIGQFLRRLRLVNLPQLINVVRGDMALVGPRPVRSEFAHRLSSQIPYYAHRFSVKPGFGGWAQLHLNDKGDRNTRREIEYDLYYIKEGSLWLDFEILLSRLFDVSPSSRGGQSQPSPNSGLADAR